METQPIDLKKLREEDEKEKSLGVPPRFGYPIPVKLGLNNSGTWVTLANGDKIWRLGIQSEGALSINLLYDKFWIPDGAKFFVYSEDQKQSIGAVTAINNKGDRNDPEGFATGLIYGESITLEYYLPNDVKDEGVISIASVVHGYRYIQLNEFTTQDFGNSGNCQVNVNCAEGSNWQQEKNAVALILVNGFRICTGSLVNTTCNDNRPVFLTANHCLGGGDAINNPNLNNWSFYWQYESPTCTNPSSEPPLRSTVGATVIANNGNTDFALLNLTEDPRNRIGVTPHYLGWDRSGNAGTGGVGIHHPQGDIKKIATYTGTPVNSTCTGDLNNNFWQTGFNPTANGHSVMEPGSSGSPLINLNRRVIGQLFRPGISALCPEQLCGNNPGSQQVSYGKFSVSWTGGGATDSRRRLSDWLNPAGGIAPNTLNGIGVLNISGPSLLCSTNSYILQNPPPGSTITWTVSNTRLFSGSTSGTGSSAVVSPFHSNSSGQATITFTVTTACGTITISKTFWVGKPAIPGAITGNTTPGPGSYTPYYINTLPAGATSMSWGLPYCVGCSQPWSFVSGQNDILITAQVGDSDGYVQAMGVNACGTGGASLLYVTTSGPCNPCARMYPNPVSNEMTLEWMDSEGFVVRF